MPIPFLSIIIPAYNEEHRLPKTLTEVAAFLATQPYTAEVLVMENGSQDKTLEIAQAFSSQNPQFTAIGLRGRGKGLAVKAGMLVARGEYRFMCDADLSMPIHEIVRFLPPQINNFDLAIGSREAVGAVRYDEPGYRHLGGRLVNTLIRLLALPGLNDTQCGFKCFRGIIAEDLFRSQTISGWSFDIEILFIARMRHFRTLEIPIPWYFSPDSKVSALKDALRMMLDIITIRRNAWQGKYQPAVPVQTDRIP
jgi:dolichyl-phosphate beta-glucosyltransferase